MKYEIVGDMLPAVICHLEAGEQMICESGAMSWMDDEIEMSTEGGGAGKVLEECSRASIFSRIAIQQRNPDR